jgi:acetamidase/formamidase
MISQLLPCIIISFTETDYLETYADNPGYIYGASSIDKAMKNAYTQTRKFVMAEYGLTEAEVTTIITNGVDFAMTQLVDGNWGVHSVIPKSIFVTEDDGFDDSVTIVSSSLNIFPCHLTVVTIVLTVFFLATF